MRPTTEFLRNRFRLFNSLMFGGELPEVPLVLSRSRNSLGCLRYRCERGPDGKKHVRDLRIAVSNLCDREERTLEDVLIHEMIHLHILHKGIKQNGPHGEAFRKMAADINKAFGRKVEVSHTDTARERQSDDRFELHIIVVLKDDGGNMMFSRIARTRVMQVCRGIGRERRLTLVGLFATTNKFFLCVPRTTTPRFYTIDADKLMAELKDATRIDTNTI